MLFTIRSSRLLVLTALKSQRSTHTGELFRIRGRMTGESSREHRVSRNDSVSVRMDFSLCNLNNCQMPRGSFDGATLVASSSSSSSSSSGLCPTFPSPSIHLPKFLPFLTLPFSHDDGSYPAISKSICLSRWRVRTGSDRASLFPSIWLVNVV